MKFNSLEEYKTKVASLDTPLYDKDTTVFNDELAVYNELAAMINSLLVNATLIPEAFKDLLVYVDSTNSCVSCHWYNYEKNDVLDDCGCSVVTFVTYQDPDLELDEDFFFYWKIIEALKKFKLQSILPLEGITIYESDEGDDAESFDF